MKNQQCVKCNHHFSYKERFYASWVNNYITCKDCGAKYKILLPRTMLVFVILMFFLLFQYFICKYYDIPFIVFFILYSLVVLLVYPIFLRYSSKNIEQYQNKN
ncbi:TIGR04104 family putative zinc finger protein [Aminipila terrae]|uniref:Cxxc_20_cxxc protein n=1 Tax=Aminipila terrae TaxID=2697030 RepID=A0A6P1MHW5_9FIRM|nr:hypothetical protein Ami3637_14860 [Aminipila terrae]